MDSTHIIQPPDPHCSKQALIMQAFMHPGIEEIWVACGTKFGKTIAAAAAISSAVIQKPRSTFRWCAPIYTQAKIGLNYCRQILPPPPHVAINNSGLEIKIPAIDSLVQFYHTQNPVSLEGYGISGYVMDEAAKMKEDVYQSAKTTVTVTRGTMLFISTPYGKNWFYRKCCEASEEMARARHEGRLPKKIFITAPTSANPFVPREAIVSAKASLSGRSYRQYFEAAFEDDGSVFTGYRQCAYTHELDIYGDEQFWLGEGARDSEVVVGADWAKTMDYCVFIAIDIQTRRVVGFQRFHKQPYTEAIRRLIKFTRKFKSTAAVYHDKTGVGMAIDDQLAFTDLNYVGITFTNASKSEMVNRLITAFEQQSLHIPTWPTLLSELEAFEVTASQIGLLRYGAAGGGHDDAVCSLMLAHSALMDYAERQTDLEYLEDLKPSALTELELMYQGLTDDDD